MDRFLRREGRWLAGLIAAFAASRLLLTLLRVPFEMGTLTSAWQFLDVELLRGDLWRSLYFLHSQPPLFNLYLGTVLQLSPVAPATVFLAVNRLLGLLVCLGTFGLLRHFRVGRSVAAAAALALVLRAGFIFDEQKLFYDLPTTALLVTAAGAFAAALAGRRWGSHLFFMALFLLCGIRSLFHLLFFALALGLYLVATRGSWRERLAPALLPLLLLLAIYAKNGLVFGQFGPSSWLGMNLARVVTKNVAEEDRAARIAAGKMAPILRLRPFVPVDAYPEYLQLPPAWEAIPALASTSKSGGAANYNHAAFLAIGRDYLAASERQIAAEPLAYLAEVGRNWDRMLEPNTGHRDLRNYAGRLPSGVHLELLAWMAGLETAPAGHWPPSPWRLGLLLLWPAVILAALIELLRPLPGLPPLPPQQRWLQAFLLLAALWVAGVGNLLEVGENARFRACTDPLVLALGGSLASRAGALLVKRP